MGSDPDCRHAQTCQRKNTALRRPLTFSYPKGSDIHGLRRQPNNTAYPTPSVLNISRQDTWDEPGFDSLTRIIITIMRRNLGCFEFLQPIWHSSGLSNYYICNAISRKICHGKPSYADLWYPLSLTSSETAGHLCPQVLHLVYSRNQRLATSTCHCNL